MRAAGFELGDIRNLCKNVAPTSYLRTVNSSLFFFFSSRTGRNKTHSRVRIGRNKNAITTFSANPLPSISNQLRRNGNEFQSFPRRTQTTIPNNWKEGTKHPEKKEKEQKSAAKRRNKVILLLSAEHQVYRFLSSSCKKRKKIWRITCKSVKLFFLFSSQTEW